MTRPADRCPQCPADPGGFPALHKMIAVQLTPRELAHATVEAAWREGAGARGLSLARYRAQRAELVRGAAAELATAVALGLTWTGIKQRGAADVGPFEVKSCQYWNPYTPPHMVMSVPAVLEDPRRPVVLVAGDPDPAVFTLVGWTYCERIAALGNVERGLRGPAYWFPAEWLFSMDVIPAGVQLPAAPALLTVDQAEQLRQRNGRPFVEALQRIRAGEAIE